MPGESKSPLFRVDVPLSNSYTLVLLQDHDTELVLRLLLKKPERAEYVTPKVRVDRITMERLTHPYPFELSLEHGLFLDSDLTTFAAIWGDKLTGWGYRKALVLAVVDLLTHVDERIYIPRHNVSERSLREWKGRQRRR